MWETKLPNYIPILFCTQKGKYHRDRLIKKGNGVFYKVNHIKVNHLVRGLHFKMIPDGEHAPLDEICAEGFHKCIVKLLVACANTSLGKILPINFLYIWVKSPEKDDWG